MPTGFYDRPSLSERFWSNVSAGDPDACWEWHGCRDGNGYGKIGVRGVMKLAHRVSMLLAGNDPGEMCVLHRCDNPPCVNPGHLFMGTKKENTQDMVVKGRARGKVSLGSENGIAKLTEESVREMRRLRGDGEKLSTLAAQYGICESNVSQICRGTAWRHVQ